MNRKPSSPKKNIILRPTGAGLFMGLILLVTLVASLNENNNLGLLLTFFLFSMALLSMAVTYRNLKGATIISMECDPVFAGETLCIHANISSPERPRTGLMLGRGKDISPPLGAGQNDRIRLSLCFPTGQRGIMQISGFSLRTQIPFGLFTASLPISMSVQAIVYPQPLAAPMPEPATGQSGQQGAATGLRRNGNEDFTGHRAYTPGDPIRRIDWKIFAKNRGLHIREFSNSGHAIILDYNNFRDMDKEERLSRLCHGILQAAASGNPFGLRLPDRVTALAATTQHRDHCLCLLSGFEKEDPFQEFFSLMLTAMEEDAGTKSLWHKLS
ncbi:DUF58 domain-containing protein [Desulfobotulus sp. H1]|uniref:DUF58 domain-containing protein n=1 Tax=Desulfobotulus pelophilus TaxID=2823377 RepID=A0ABT3NA00_9BACT|nr:DUF58 domain-containing protein [Desulfobotulus pelophilus]MCW7754260.1 DUF58 domain-containing protein [Desulfobotulus pelophilus]